MANAWDTEGEEPATRIGVEEGAGEASNRKEAEMRGIQTETGMEGENREREIGRYNQN